MEKNPPLRALLLEDDPADAEVVRRYLAQVGPEQYAITWATSTEEARQWLGKETFDLVLLDLRLPDTDENETFEAVLAAAPQLPLVVLTGAGNESMGADMVRRGAQDFLVKGKFDPATLGRTVRYAVARNSMMRELAKARADEDSKREASILERLSRHSY